MGLRRHYWCPGTPSTDDPAAVALGSAVALDTGTAVCQRYSHPLLPPAEPEPTDPWAGRVPGRAALSSPAGLASPHPLGAPGRRG